MVEFALIAPMFFLLLLAVSVLGITTTNQNLLTNAVRDIARATAVCGGSNRDAGAMLPPTGAQAAQTCTYAHLDTYVTARLNQVVGGGPSLFPPPTVTTTNCAALAHARICLYDSTDSPDPIDTNALDDGVLGDKVAISAQFQQNLYAPLVGTFFGNGGSTTTRTLTAEAEATVEQ